MPVLTSLIRSGPSESGVTLWHCEHHFGSQSLTAYAMAILPDSNTFPRMHAAATHDFAATQQAQTTTAAAWHGCRRFSRKQRGQVSRRPATKSRRLPPGSSIKQSSLASRDVVAFQANCAVQQLGKAFMKKHAEQSFPMSRCNERISPSRLETTRMMSSAIQQIPGRLCTKAPCVRVARSPDGGLGVKRCSCFATGGRFRYNRSKS